MRIIHFCSTVLRSLFFGNILRKRSMVIFLPRISIISATPGPSDNPLNLERRDFMNFGNFKLFFAENSLSKICKCCLSKSPFSNWAISDSSSSAWISSFFILGKIHRNDKLPSTSCWIDVIRSLAQCNTLRMCARSKTSVSTLSN